MRVSNCYTPALFEELTYRSEMLVIYKICLDLINGKSKNKVVQAFSSLWKGKQIKSLVEEVKGRVDEHWKLFLVSLSIQSTRLF